MKLTLTLPEPYTAKQTPLSTIVFNTLKDLKIPGNRVLKWYETNTPEYIMRQYWKLEYMMENTVIGNRVAYLSNLINEDYPDSEMFLYWLEAKKQKILSDPNSSDDLIKLVSI